MTDSDSNQTFALAGNSISDLWVHVQKTKCDLKLSNLPGNQVIRVRCSELLFLC